LLHYTRGLSLLPEPYKSHPSGLSVVDALSCDAGVYSTWPFCNNKAYLYRAHKAHVLCVPRSRQQ
jgi:hypothetical protein